MADLQIGNEAGVTAVGNADGKIAEIAADQANSFLTSDVNKFYIGQSIIFRVKSTGAVFGTTARTVTAISSLGITYDGADLALVPGTHAVYDADMGVGVATVGSNHKTNINGGTSARDAWQLNGIESIQSLRARLFAFNSTTFSQARLDKMTMNDMLYAYRMSVAASTVK